MDISPFPPHARSRFRSDQSGVVLWSAAIGLLLLHLVANAFTSYGYFRDEFYYLACSRHLAWGYVDQPPFSVFVLALTRWLWGDSLSAIRLVPALAHVATLWLTGLTAQRMGGKSVAVLLACLCVSLAPILLAMGTYYSMNSLDILLWTAGGYLLVRLVQQGSARWWIFLGILMGIGLLNKLSFLWFGTGLLAGLLLTPLRKHLLTPWPYLAGVIAFILFTPFIIWNFQHDFAHLEFMERAMRYKYAGVTRLDFLAGQLLLPNPVALLVWLPGLYYYFVQREGNPYRVLGYIFLVTLLILLANGHSKAEYLAAAYPLLFAGGGVMLERIASARPWRWLPYAAGGLLLLTAGLVPLAVPLLPVQDFVAYQRTLGIGVANSEGKETAELPQFYADMFGWEALAATVSEAYRRLPEGERAQARVYAGNYGEAGALQHYRRRYDLPPVISGHNNYWLWGYGEEPLQTIIIVGGNKEEHLQSFKEVEQVAVHRTRYAMPYENNLPIYVGRQPRHPARILWQGTKNYS